jgi:hypothetical protein
MMLLSKEAVLYRVYSAVMFFKDSVKISRQLNSVPLQPSGRRDIPSGPSTVRTTRTFCRDLPLCREASNCSNLHPSKRRSSTSGCHSVFVQLWDFFSKHRYGKTAATVRTMWILVRMHSFISQVEHSKFRCLDDSLHGPNTRALDMEIACIRFITRTKDVIVRTRQALIWKLRAAKRRSSGR